MSGNSTRDSCLSSSTGSLQGEWYFFRKATKELKDRVPIESSFPPGDRRSSDKKLEAKTLLEAKDLGKGRRRERNDLSFSRMNPLRIIDLPQNTCILHLEAGSAIAFSRNYCWNGSSLPHSVLYGDEVKSSGDDSRIQKSTEIYHLLRFYFSQL